jgi:hypothetical protein
MRQFNIGSAWTKGTEFISRNAAGHAVILIGMGILVPGILQFAIVGGVAGMNPMMMGQNAILYGIVCAVLALVAFFLFAMLIAVIGAQAFQVGGAMALLALVVAVPVLILMAALYSVIVAAMAVGMFLMLLVVLAFGASMGASNAALAMAGQGGLAVLIVLAVMALLFWATARFSCTTTVMADRKSFNLFAGLAESWRLTGPNQFRIMAYLGLLGILLCVVLVVIVMVLGASMMGSISSGEAPSMGIGSQIMLLAVGIPFAYLTVIVPAGIYRELFEEASVAEVFA